MRLDATGAELTSYLCGHPLSPTSGTALGRLVFPRLYVIAQPSGASRKGDSDDTRAESRRWAARLRGRGARAAVRPCNSHALIEEVIGTARQLAEQNAIGSTVTIFQPVVMHLRLTSSLVPAHPTTSTQQPRVSLPQLASRGECLAIIGLAVGGDLAKTAPQERPESADGALLVFRVRRTRRNGKLPSRDRSSSSSTSRTRIGRTTGLIKDFNIWIDPQIVHPNRISRAPPCDPTRT